MRANVIYTFASFVLIIGNISPKIFNKKSQFIVDIYKKFSKFFNVFSSGL